MSENPNEFMWAQAYRPSKIDDCILPPATKTLVKEMVAKGEITHMIFSGGPGCGKTTLAYAIAHELNADCMYINAALENGIDVLRTRISSFASTVSLSSDGPKIVILDEADGLTPIMQGALKGFLESFSANCRFIFTCNVRHKIIEPIQSRCTVVDFKIDATDKPKIAASFFKRITEILKQENIEYDQAVVAKIVTKNFPDFRKTLNELQRHSQTGKIDVDILNDHTGDSFKELIGFLKQADFTNVRKWVGQNEDIDTATLFRAIYDIALVQMKPKSLPELILHLANYGYKSAFCVDQQINTMACMLEIMTTCEWE